MSYDSREYSVQDGAPIELWAFTSEGAALEYYYTNNEEPISFGGRSYEPIHMKRDTIDLNAIIVSPKTYSFSLPYKSDIGRRYGKSYAPPKLFVRVWKFHEDDNEMQKQFFGSTVSFSVKDSMIIIQAKPIIESLVNRPIGAHTFNAKCNHQFCDTRCGLNIDDYTTHTTILAINGQYVTVASTGGAGDDLLLGDCIINDEFRPILGVSGNIIHVRYPYTIAEIGDAVTLRQGCLRTKPACDGYNNFVQFGGFTMAPDTNPIKTTTKPDLFNKLGLLTTWTK